MHIKTFILIFIFIITPVFYSHGGEHIVLYRLGSKETVAWDQFRRYLIAKGYKISIFDGTDNIEKHVEIVNKINTLRAAAFFAMDFGIGDKNQIMVAITTAKKGNGNILAIDEVPFLYANESRELASSLASAFNKGIKEFPLFPLLGVDMPGVYVKIIFTPDKTLEVFSRLHEGMQGYFNRGRKNER